MAVEGFGSQAMRVLRVHADETGETRFASATISLELKDFAPPAPPLHVSAPQPAANWCILEVGPGWGGLEPHPAPSRIMAISLSGRTRITTSSGESHIFVAGDAVLLEDTVGKGHGTQVISDEPARWVFIRLPSAA